MAASSTSDPTTAIAEGINRLRDVIDQIVDTGIRVIRQVQRVVSQVVEVVTRVVEVARRVVTQIVSILLPGPPANQSPAVALATVSPPDPGTGVVTGMVSASDPDGDPVTFTAPAVTAKGTVEVVSSSGAFIYTPTAAARHAAAADGASAADRTDTFTVAVADGRGGSAAVQVTVAVGPANTAPEAGVAVVGAPDPATGVVIGALIAGDPDGDSLTFTAPASTAKGTVEVDSSSGAFTYTPTAAARESAAQSGATPADKADTLTVTVTDGHGGIAAVPVSVVVAPANQSPVAAVAAVSLPDPGTGEVTGTVSATDPDGDPLTFTAPASTAKGTVSIDPNTGAFTYTPTTAARDAAAREFATRTSTTVLPGVSDLLGYARLIPETNLAYVDSYDAATGIFSIAVFDFTTQTIVATIPFTSPNTQTDDFVVNGDGTRAYVTTITYDDAAVRSDKVSWIGLSVIDTEAHAIIDTIPFPANAGINRIAINPSGTRLYVPTYNYGVDASGELTSGSSSMTVIDTATNSIIATVPFPGTSAQGTFAGPGFGPVAVNPDGTRVYVETWYTDPTTAEAISAFSVIDTATNTIVGAIDYPEPDTFMRRMTFSPDGTRLYVDSCSNVQCDGTTDTVIVLDTVANTVAATIAHPAEPGSTPWAGGQSISPDGRYLYVAATDEIFDDNGNLYARTGSIKVIDTATRAIIGKIGFPSDSSVNYDTYPVGITLSGDGTRLHVITETTTYANGDYAVTGAAMVTYDLDLAALAARSDTVTVTVSDGQATIGIEVTVPVRATDSGNQTPSAVDDTIATSMNTPVTIRADFMLANDTDPDGDTLTVTGVSEPAHGYAGLDGPTIIYTPTGNYIGDDSFTYTVSDGHDGIATATVTVTIAETAVAIDTIDGTTGVVTGHVTIGRPAGDELTYAIGTPPMATFGKAVVDPTTGVFTFTPTATALVNAYTENPGLRVDFTVNVVEGSSVFPVGVSVPVEVLATDDLMPILARSGSHPSGVAVGPDSTVYVINAGANTISVLNPDMTSIISTVEVGDAPSAVRVGPDGRVWVANGADGTVTVLDRTATTIEATIDVGSSPTGLAIGTDGSVFVVGAGDAAIRVINAATNALDRTITLGGTPIGIAAAPDGRIYITDFSGSAIRIIDPQHEDALTTIDVAETNPYGIAVDTAGTIYVTHPLKNTVSVLNPTANSYVTRTVPVGTTPTSITLGANGFVYVTNTDANTITAIDPHTFTTTTTPTGANPNSIAAGTGAHMYITNGGSDSLSIVNVDSTSATTVPIGIDPNTVSVDANGNINVTSDYSNTVSIIARPTTGTVTMGTVTTGITTTGTVTTGTTAHGDSNPAASPDGRYAYIVDGDSGTVSIINPAAGTTTTIATGNDPAWVIVSPDSRYAYVTNTGSGTVSIINPATGTATTIATGNDPDGLIVSPDSRYAYVTNTGSGTVSIINPETGTATTIPTGNDYYAIEVSPDGRYAYTENNDGTVSVINPATGAATTIPAGHNLRYLVVSPDSRYLYITGDNYGQGSGFVYDNVVSIINPATGTAITVPVSHGDGYGTYADVEGVSPDGRYALVSHYVDDSNNYHHLASLSVINPDNGTATTIPIDDVIGSNEFVFSADSRYAYVAGTNKVHLINLTTATASTIALGPASHLVSLDNGYAYFIGSTRDVASGRYHAAVSVLNPMTSAVSTIPLPSEVRYLRVSPDSRYAYIVGQGLDGSSLWDVSVLNFATGAVATISLGQLYSVDPDLVVSPDSRYAYLTSSGYDSSTAWIIDSVSGTATTIPLGGAIDDSFRRKVEVVVSPDSRYAYLTSRYLADTGAYYAVTVLNPATGTTATVTVDGADNFTDFKPGRVVVSPDSRYAYVQGMSWRYQDWESGYAYEDTMTVINPATGTSTSVPTFSAVNPRITGNYYASVDVSPDGRYAYVTNYFDGVDGFVTTLTVIDPTKLTFPSGGIAPDYWDSTYVDTPVTFDPTATLFTPDTGVTVTGISQPANGTAALNGSRITYTPRVGYTGTDTFTYTGTGTDGVTTDTGNIAIAVELDRVSTSVPYVVGPTGTQDLYSTLRDAMDGKDGKSLQHGVYTEKVLVDGREALIVYIAGTKDGWFDGDQSKIKNLPSAAGIVDNNQITVIKDAMNGKELPILLVGYSQGGMDAQNIAANAALYGLQDQIKAVITYGSPLVQTDRYPTVHLEDAGDVVPKVNLFTPTNWIAGIINSAVNKNVYLNTSTTNFKHEWYDPIFVHGDPQTYEDAGLAFDVDTSSHWNSVKDALNVFLNGKVVPPGYTVINGNIVERPENPEF